MHWAYMHVTPLVLQVPERRLPMKRGRYATGMYVTELNQTIIPLSALLRPNSTSFTTSFVACTVSRPRLTVRENSM